MNLKKPKQLQYSQRDQVQPEVIIIASSRSARNSHGKTTPKGPFIHSANANESNANTNATATFETFCHSNIARTRTRKTVDGLQGGSSFTCLRYQIWSFGIMVQV